MLERFISNLSTKVRRDTLEGKEYIVAPVVMLTEGVHQGNGGPLYYPGEELAKVPAVWNHKPLVVYHPTDGIACTPAVLNTRKVGLIFNAAYDAKAKKLRAEAWIDPERAAKVDSRIIECLDCKKVMEVSTGLFTENEMVEGEWNGESYIAIAKNYKPDHLALLPDQKGACSIADGAGLLVSNSMSHSNIHTALNMALRTRLSIKADEPWNGWVEDVYDTFFIYQADGKLYRLSYTEKDDSVEISNDEPEPVKRVTEYRKAEDGSFVGNERSDETSSTTESEMKMNTKKDNVEALISNASTIWTADERQHLMAMSDATIQKLAEAAEAPVTTTTVSPATQLSQQTTPAPQVNNTASVVTPVMNLEQYMAAAPPAIQQMFAANLAVIEREKNRCIDIIVANKANQFSKEWLATKDLPELQGLAAIASAGITVQQQALQPVPMFAGQAGAPVFNTGGHVQPLQQFTEEPLETPVLNFDERKPAKFGT
jgi:hypothetical protein